jgi:programmed cell death protein 4
MSASVKAKALKVPEMQNNETKGTEEGSAKRNIIRHKTDPRETGNYDSRNKKQGGHGKGKWKDDEFLYDDTLDPIDQNDPIYDEQEDAYVLSSHENPITKIFDPSEGKAVYGPMLTQSEFKIQCTEALREYFDSCDADELIRSLEELQCKEYHPDVVKRAISISLDKNSRERELVSRLLTCLHPKPLSEKDMEAGFNILLDSMDDLCTDVPEATVSTSAPSIIHHY